MTQPGPIHLLVATSSVDAANRLISGLRGAGLGVRSANAGHERELAVLLAQGQWDVLVCFASERLPLSAVLVTLQKSELELPLLYVGVAPDASQLLCQQGVRELFAPDTHASLLATVRREAELMQTKRRLRQLELQHRELEKRHELLLDGSTTAISYVQDGIHLASNQSYASAFGHDNNATIATTPFLDLLSPDTRPRIKALLSQPLHSEVTETLLIRRPRGAEEPMELCFTPVEYHGKACVQIRVTEARGNAGYAATVTRIAHQDLLTRLYNGAHFLTCIEHAIRAAIQDNVFSSLLLIELTEFADIGATIGRSSANIVVNDVARLLQELITDQDAVARIDEHTFGILLHTGDPDKALELARKIQGRLNNHISPAMLTTVELGCAIGLALINGLTGNAEAVLVRARANLRDKPLKASRQLQYRIGEELHHDAGAMLDYLKSALLNRRFKLLFQPLVSIKGESYKSYEVLTRMLDRDGNEVSPAAFLPLANLNGVGEEIDRLVTGMALDSIRDTRAAERLLINITSNTLLSRTFLPWLSEKLRNDRIPSDQLVLQISEVDIHANPAQALDFCHGLRELHAAMAITHFGCALEPFAILDELKPVIVKLDETLVRDIIYSPQQIQNVQTMIRTLHKRGLIVIAPQVEDMDVLPILWQTGADYVQGYCLQRPSDEMNYEFLHVEEITLLAVQN